MQKCGKDFSSNRNLQIHMSKKTCIENPCIEKPCIEKPCIEKPCIENPLVCENITLIIEEEPERKDKTFEYYQKYLNLYNELDMFRKDNCELIHKGTSVWIQNMRELNIHFKECFFNYNLKRTYWKPIKSQCLVSMLHKMREKRETKWNKNNKNISMDYYYAKWNRKMTYVCVDIRDYFGRPKL